MRVSLKRVVRGAMIALVAAGCASAPRVIPISASSQPAKPAAQIVDYPDAMHAISAVVSRDLGLPIPTVSLYIYPSRDAFMQGLIAEQKFEPALARDSAQFARGVGGSTKILVNEAALARTPWPERIRFLAHEFTHTIQYHLARGRRGSSVQWLREGYADWVSYRTEEALGLGRYADGRALRLRQLTNIRRSKRLPSLNELSEFPQWVSWRNKQGREVTYNQAFLAVDLLIERGGHAAVIEYFQLFAGSDDGLANFRRAFGQVPRAFEREFAIYLEGLR